MFLGCEKESKIIIDEAKKEAESIRLKVKKEAETIISEAKKEAESTISIAEKKAKLIDNQADRIKRTNEKKLNEVFGHLNKLIFGENEVNERYIKSFEVKASKIKFIYTNNEDAPIQPDFEIYFVNKYGFITSSNNINWYFETIKKGEVKIEEKNFNNKFGIPAYYYIEFEND